MSKSFPMVPLGECALPVVRPVTPMPGTVYRQIGVRLWGEGAYEREPMDGSQTKYNILSRVEADDFIVNKIWARNGSVAVVPKYLAGSYVSAEFPTFASIPEKLSPYWFHWLTKTKNFWQQCDEKSRGTSGKNRIRPERFLEIKFPLPPLAEQQRIVARIEELAAKLEKARGLRREAVEEAETVYGSAAVAILNAQLNANLIPIENLAEVRGGIQKSPDRLPGSNPVRYLTVAHVHRNHISLTDPRFFEVSPTEIDRWQLKPGDVLIIEGNGSANQIGRTALFRGEIDECVHQNHVIRIRPDQKRIDPEFLNIYLNCPLGQQEVQSRSRTTSGLRNLSVGRINQISILVPPLPEQRRIVSYLDSLQAKVDALKQLQAETSAELNALLPSILDKAFRGEL